MINRTEDINGVIRYTNEKGQLHREDGPALIEYGKSKEEWYFNGHKHRDEGYPAVIYALGATENWEHGVKTSFRWG